MHPTLDRILSCDVICALGLIGVTALAAIGCYLHRKHTKSIAGRHVVVTGGSQGIGLWAAVRAAQLGANVTIVARNQAKLEEAKKLVESHRLAATQRIHIASIDVCSDYDLMSQQLTDVEAANGPIYMLVNCPGMAICGTIDDTSVATARRLMDINYFGTFQPIRYVLDGLRKRNEGGIIVLTSSVAGLMGVYGMGAYCASKFALRGLAETLALENAHLGISVTLALPGDTDTPGYETENKTKPQITKLMCDEGGLAQPSDMGRQIIEDALRGHFFSVYDSTGWAVATMCAGLAPWGGWLQVLASSVLVGPLKIYSAVLVRSFKSLVRKELAK